MAIVAAIFSGFALALAAPRLRRVAGARTGWLLALLPLAVALYSAFALRHVARSGPFQVAYPWVPGLSIDLAFHVDGLSALFALLIAGIGNPTTARACSFAPASGTIADTRPPRHDRPEPAFHRVGVVGLPGI